MEGEARGRPRSRWEESFVFQALRWQIRKDETNSQNAGTFIAIGVTESCVLSVTRCY